MERDDLLAAYEDKIRGAMLNAEGERLRNVQQEIMMGDREKSTIQEQLDLSNELDTIEYLARGYVLSKDEDGNRIWVPPKDEDMVILTEYGIQTIMEPLYYYGNKNILLSNYDDKTILQKMEDFASDLADDIFMNYEKVFKYPTLKECKEEIKIRIDKKVELRKFAKELLGLKHDDIETRKEILKEMEGRIERELEIVKAQKMKSKLKRFAMIMRKVQDFVHSAYLRAWKGQERTTLRQHIHISESRGSVIPQQNTGGSLNPLEWIKKRR
jgi:hypothetical protein